VLFIYPYFLQTPLVTGDPGPITLTAGTQYWLVLNPVVGALRDQEYWLAGGSSAVTSAVIDYNEFIGQNGSGPIDQPPMWLPNGQAAFQFEIDGTPLLGSSAVPEPAALLLAGSGLTLVGWRLRRRQVSLSR
jgi:hypothetical protein